MNSIFILTVIKYKDQNDYPRDRSWAWFKSVDNAIESINRNADWYCENGYYNYILIEEYHEGNFMAVSEHWYQIDFDPETDTYSQPQKIDKPEWSMQTCNWSIG